MQKIISLFTLMFLSFGVNAQVTKIYGYFQEVQGGMRQENEPSQKEEDRVTESGRYFLFTETGRGKTIFFKQLWIRGKSFSFKTDTIKKIPFILSSFTGGDLVHKDTLIRASRQQIIQLTDIVKTKNATPPSNIKRLTAINDVVIVVKYQRKLLTFTLRKLKSVTPLFTQ